MKKCTKNHREEERALIESDAAKAYRSLLESKPVRLTFLRSVLTACGIKCKTSEIKESVVDKIMEHFPTYELLMEKIHDLDLVGSDSSDVQFVEVEEAEEKKIVAQNINGGKK